MIRYRIKVEQDINGKYTYTPERRSLWLFWVPVWHHHNVEECKATPVVCDSSADAHKYIQVDAKLRAPSSIATRTCMYSYYDKQGNLLSRH